ncbi:MAG: tryptophan-rich sensory protein [Anaerolineae bacterium]|nr:tryptophan-rich sensory protein [Anaerolineae bacterium]
MNKNSVRQAVNVLATLLTLVVNGLANALPLNGKTTGEVSDSIGNYFVPAGYVFSIWGLIYLALIAFTIYQALPAQRDNPLLKRVGYLYALSCLANSAWIFFWHYEQFAWTLVVMVVLLLSLIAIYLRVGIGRRRVSNVDKWFVQVPFSIYLGWITVATVANVTALLVNLQWNGWGLDPRAWAVIMVIAAAAIASAVSVTRGDIGYVLVIVWAFIGIVVRQSAALPVAIAAGLMAAAVALTLLIGVPRARARLRVPDKSF